MSEYIFIIPIAIALLVGVMSPGPSFFLIAQNAMSNTREKALYMALGLGVGAAVLALIACTGLYLLLTKMPTMFLVFKVLGGAYLCFISYKIFMSTKSKSKNQALHVKKQTDNFKSFLLGLLTQLSNPKTVIIIGGIIAAFLPQITPPYTYLYICIVAFILDFSWYSIVAITLSTKKAQNTYMKYKNYINYIASLLIAFIGTKLIFL